MHDWKRRDTVGTRDLRKWKCSKCAAFSFDKEEPEVDAYIDSHDDFVLSDSDMESSLHQADPQTCEERIASQVMES